MPKVEMTMEELLNLLAQAQPGMNTESIDRSIAKEARKTGKAVSKAVKRKTSGYGKKYGAAFKKTAAKYKTKAGKWKKGGFKRAVREAHKMAGGRKR